MAARVDERAGGGAVFSQRMARLVAEIDQGLRDLVAFVPLWLDGIEMRRALLLRRNAEMEQGHGAANPSPRAKSESESRVAEVVAS